MKISSLSVQRKPFRACLSATRRRSVAPTLSRTHTRIYIYTCLFLSRERFFCTVVSFFSTIKTFQLKKNRTMCKKWWKADKESPILSTRTSDHIWSTTGAIYTRISTFFSRVIGEVVDCSRRTGNLYLSRFIFKIFNFCSHLEKAQKVLLIFLKMVYDIYASLSIINLSAYLLLTCNQHTDLSKMKYFVTDFPFSCLFFSFVVSSLF